MKHSHCDILLRSLKRNLSGITHKRLYRLGMVVHSRISDLRRRGYQIDCKRVGEDYVYKLGGRN